MRNTCLAYGTFESVHKGHLKIAETVVSVAREKGLKSAIISIPETGEVFTTEEEKEYLFKKIGIEAFLTCEAMGVEELVRVFDVRVLVVGETSKNLEEVKTAVEKTGAEVVVVPAVKVNEEVVTMDLVKTTYEANDYERLSELCGHPYLMIGEVVHGKALGRTEKMPTANLKVPDEKIKPLDAVYCTRVRLGDEVLKTVTNIGKRPSVDDFNYVTIETLILDFDRDIYGQKLVLEVHKYIRDVMKFDSLAEVKAQIDKDIEEVKNFFDFNNS
ncbi:MAG: riboflavin biosynthesis protein RibF [Tyzzerella sp.]|nr:riboflavin biosynthesis protein RibF [Tyzzerella sp.]